MISYARNWTLLLFFLTLSHAVMIQQRNRKTIVIPEVYKRSRKTKASTTTFQPHKCYNSTVEFSIIGQARHEKDFVSWFGRI